MTNTDDKNVAAIVSLANIIAERDDEIAELRYHNDNTCKTIESLSRNLDEEYRKTENLNMALQNQQVRPLADVEDELDDLKAQFHGVARQKDELFLSVITNPRSFLEAVEYLDSALRLDLHEKIVAIGKVKELTGLSLANATGLVKAYISRRELNDEDDFWNGVERDKKKGGCAGCSGGCCGNRVLVIPDESGTGSISGYPKQVYDYDTAGNATACTMGCADTQSTISVFPNSEWPHDKAFNTDPATTLTSF